LKNKGCVVQFVWFGLLDGKNGSFKAARNADEKQRKEITSKMKPRYKD